MRVLLSKVLKFTPLDLLVLKNKKSYIINELHHEKT